jgi:membrane protein
MSREKLLKGTLLSAILAISVATVGLILTGINQFKLGSQFASMNQVTNLSHLLVRQQANLLSIMLANDAQTEELNEALDTFAKENFVVDANIHSPNGVLIAQSANAQELSNVLKESENQTTQQIVEPIFAQQNLLGFLRVTFDAHYAQETKSKVDLLFNKLYGELIILVLVGFLVAGSVHSFLQKRVVYAVETPKTRTKMPAKTQAKRFYSRRRAFGRK